MGAFHGNQHTDNEFDGYDYNRLVEDLRTLADELDRAPTTRDARDDDRLPCLARIYSVVETDWAGALRDAGVEPGNLQVGEYDDSDRSAVLADLERVYSETETESLVTRQYQREGRYATSTVKKHFGSWRAACEACGISPGERHGERVTGPEGATLESRHELSVATYLHESGIEYVTHPAVDDTTWTADFYLPEQNLWVEVDGYLPGMRPNAEGFEAKLDHYERTGRGYVVVRTADELASFVDADPPDGQ